MTWQDHARCKGQPLAAFFPERGESVNAAKAVCAECPVVLECLQYALDTDAIGVWGNTSERQRRALRAGAHAVVVRACRASNVGWADRGDDSPPLLTDTLTAALARMDTLGYRAAVVAA